GAGRTLALKALEDTGFEALDNLPITLIGPALGAAAPNRAVAIGVDIRTRGFDPSAVADVLSAQRRASARSMRLLFIDCDDDVLARRFTETRRAHPFAADRPVADGLTYERGLLAALKNDADDLIDTTLMAPQDLRRHVVGLYADEAKTLTVFVTSFSFKRGLPREADLVFDVRFLRNPHYDETLRPMNGRDAAVADYVAADPEFTGFFERLSGLVTPLLPRYRDEGKRYLTVAIGCTGGQHRSVAVAERLGAALAEAGWPAQVAHRDVKSNPSPVTATAL
ncbi:MAG: RNase adapter RapZ, partial [Pseudomonadota bacterium]